MTLIPFGEIEAELVKDPEFRAAYDALAPAFDLAHTVIAARASQGLTQAELATRMNTTQSYIARLESGKVLPSMRTWLKLPPPRVPVQGLPLNRSAWYGIRSLSDLRRYRSP